MTAEPVGQPSGYFGVGFRHDRRPAAAVDRAIDAASARQAAVGRVDDRIDLFEGDVALVEFQRLGVDLDAHGQFAAFTSRHAVRGSSRTKSQWQICAGWEIEYTATDF